MNTRFHGPYRDKIEPGTIVLNKYFIQKRIGEGTFSRVFHVIDLHNGDQYALKCISRDKINKKREDMILREISVQKGLSHSNIVKLFEINQDDNYIFLILEYVSMGEMYDYIDQKGILNESEAAKLFMQILRAVHYCHLKNIMHRDIKPENLFLTEDFRVKLGDFGWATSDKTSSELAGTPEYMAPEIIDLDGSYDMRVDIWSLGVLLYELLFGISPFSGTDCQETMQRIIYQELDFPENVDVSDEAIHLIRRLLDRNPKTRIDMIGIFLNPWVCKYWNSSIVRRKGNHQRSLSNNMNQQLKMEMIV